MQMLGVARGGFVGCGVPSSPSKDRTKTEELACEQAGFGPGAGRA